MARPQKNSKDLQWWKSAHNVLRGAPITRQNQTPSCSQMHRTSAGEHIGMELHINVLELDIHRAMLHWLRKLMGLTVLVASDNSTVMSYINKQGGTRSIQLCRRTKKLLLMCQANQIVLRHDTSLGDSTSLQTYCCALPRCQVQNGLCIHLSSEH